MVWSRATDGSTMIEVLVSMVILAMGLLGMMSLQLVSLRVTQNALLLTRATILAQDMLERMHANPVSVASGVYTAAPGVADGACFEPAGCSPQAMAKTDLAQWHSLLVGSLPGVHAVICVDSTPDDGAPDAPACDTIGNWYAIKLWWDGNRDGLADQRLVTVFRS